MVFIIDTNRWGERELLLAALLVLDAARETCEPFAAAAGAVSLLVGALAFEAAVNATWVACEPFADATEQYEDWWEHWHLKR